MRQTVLLAGLAWLAGCVAPPPPPASTAGFGRYDAEGQRVAAHDVVLACLDRVLSGNPPQQWDISPRETPQAILARSHYIRGDGEADRAFMEAYAARYADGMRTCRDIEIGARARGQPTSRQWALNERRRYLRQYAEWERGEDKSVNTAINAAVAQDRTERNVKEATDRALADALAVRARHALPTPDRRDLRRQIEQRLRDGQEWDTNQTFQYRPGRQ